MILNKHILLFATLLSALLIQQSAMGQGSNEEMKDADLKNTIETLSSQSDNEFDYNTIIEDLKQYADHPINLNHTDVEELNDLGLLTPIQVDNLFQYIATYGKLIAIYELQAIPNLDLETIRKILPYVKINSDLNDFHVKTKDLIFKGDYQLFLRYQQILEKQKGYLTEAQGGSANGYLGSPFRFYTRFRYNYGTKISYGITAEKDAGEQFFKGTQKRGFDYYSGHIYVKDVSVFKAIALGDYSVNLGQGLIMWTGFGFGKSPFVMNVKRQSRKIRPYTSVTEFNYLRGGAFTIGLKSLEISAFASYNKIDANVSNQDTLNRQVFEVTSLQQSGFHRTQAEIDDRETIKQLVTGGNISFNKRKYHIGFNAVYSTLSAPLNSTLRPYSQYNFVGTHLLNASMDYHLIIKNFHFFGEEAISDNGGFGFLNGVLIGLGNSVEMSVVHRYYARNFQTLFARPFAESSSPQNEHGTYIGISLKPFRKIKVDGYLDFFKFPWLRFGVDRPSFGYDAFAQFNYIPSKKTLLYARYKHQQKQVNLSNNTGYFNEIVNERTDNFRINIDAKVNDAITLSSRVEMSFYKQGSGVLEKGFLMYQDVGYKALSFPVAFSVRVALFQTQGYNTRIYAYEDDVLYSFSIPAYQDRGMRYYLNARWTIYKGIDLWVRFAQTYLSNKKNISSGLEEISGSTKSEIKAQIRFKF